MKFTKNPPPLRSRDRVNSFAAAKRFPLSKLSTMAHRYTAFTLSDVIITLGIIGVVAAMTIPALMARQEKIQYVAKLKKAYTQMNQALQQMAADNGCIGDLKCTGLFNSNAVGQDIAKYFIIAKNCGSTHDLGCMPRNANNSYDGTGSLINLDANNWGLRFITSDGFSFNVENGGGSNCAANSSTNKTGNLKQICGYVELDINGPTKGPNYLGRDIYNFWISNGKGPLLYPVGGSDDGNSGWWKSHGGCGNNIGSYCAARILEEGWEMNY